MLFLTKSRLRRQLLVYSFTHPDESFYVRELAVLLKEDPGNLSRELKKLEAEGIFQSSPKGNLKFYSLNKSYPLFQELKNMVFKTEGIAGTLARVLGRYERITRAFIYGSYAKGLEKSTSDIDLIIVGRFPRDPLAREIRDLESKVGREINFTAYLPEEFEAQRKKTGDFLNLVLKDKVVWLKGNANA